MKVKITLQCGDCGNTWEVNSEVKDMEEDINLEPFKCCKVCDGERISVVRVEDNFGIAFDNREPNYTEIPPADSFKFVCPYCLNVWWMTANVPCRCPYCRDMPTPEPEAPVITEDAPLERKWWQIWKR